MTLDRLIEEAHDRFSTCHTRAETEALRWIAMEFAEEVLRDAMADWSLFRYDNFGGDDVDKYIANAIAAAAAAKGE